MTGYLFTAYPTRFEYFQGPQGFGTYEEYLYACGLINEDVYHELTSLLEYRLRFGNDDAYHEHYEERLYKSGAITEEVYHLLLG